MFNLQDRDIPQTAWDRLETKTFKTEITTVLQTCKNDLVFAHRVHESKQLEALN